jgi:hypothetical protein
MPREPVNIARAARRAVEAGGPPVTEKPKPLQQPESIRLVAEGAAREKQHATANSQRISLKWRGTDAIAYEHGVAGTEALGPPDEEMEHFLGTPATGQMGAPGTSLTGYSINEEVAEMELLGTLRPFVEGEPIGCIRTDPPRVPPPSMLTRAEIMEGRRRQMLDARNRNDAVLESLLRKCR